MTGKPSTYLVHHVDKSLCVDQREAADRFTFILTRNNRFDQRRQVAETVKCASDQSSIGYNVVIGKEQLGVISIPYNIRKG